MALEKLISKGKNFIKQAKKNSLPYFLSTVIAVSSPLYFSSCSSGGGSSNGNNSQTLPVVEDPVIEEPIIEEPIVEEPTVFDYTTTTTVISSEYIESDKGGVVDTYNSKSLIDGRSLEIPSKSLKEDTIISMNQVDNPPGFFVEQDLVLTYVGTPVDLEPNGTTFDKLATLKINYSDAELSDAGVSDESKLKLFQYDTQNKLWNELQIKSRELENNLIASEIDHFSYYVLLDELNIPDKNLGTPKLGDLLYKTGAFGVKFPDNVVNPSNMWMPGHVGIYTGEKKYSGEGLASEDVIKYELYNVVEALGNGVQYSYYNLPNVTETYENELEKFEKRDIYMGAREPKTDSLTDAQRKKIVEFAEAQIGKPYVWDQTGGVFFGMLSGDEVKGPDKFNCVGLAESAYEYVGVNGGIGLTDYEQEEEGNPPVLTPKEHYNQTKPAGCDDRFDTNCDGSIDQMELDDAMVLWENGKISEEDFSSLVKQWAEGNNIKLPDLAFDSVEFHKSLNCSEFPYLKIGFKNIGNEKSIPFNYEFILNASCLEESRIFNSKETFREKINSGETKNVWIPLPSLNGFSQENCDSINLERLVIDSENDILEWRKNNNIILNQEASFFDVEDCKPEVPVCEDVINTNCDKCIDKEELKNAERMWKNNEITIGEMMDYIAIWKECTGGKLPDLEPEFVSAYGPYGGTSAPYIQFGFRNNGEGDSGPFDFKIIIRNECLNLPNSWAFNGRVEEGLKGKSSITLGDELSLGNKTCKSFVLESFVLDSNNEILESKEDNNSISNMLINYISDSEEPIKLPNLVITDFGTWYYISIESGASYYHVTTRVEVANVGEADSPPYSIRGNINISPGGSDYNTSIRDTDGLKVGEKETFRLKKGYLPRIKDLYQILTLENFIIDSDNEVQESDEEDNCIPNTKITL